MIDTVKSAITVKDDRAYYELQAERIDCYVGFRHAGSPVDVHVSVKPYAQDRMIQCLKADEGYRKPAKDEPGSIDVDQTNPELTRAFVDEHLIEMRIGDRVLTSKEVETLDARHGLKPMAFTVAYNGLLIEFGDAEDLSIDDILSDKVTVSLYVRLCDEKGVQQRVNLDHHFSSPTAKDALAFSRSSKVRTTREGNVKLPVNYEARVKLYDSLIQSVDGVLTNGELCGPNNKEEWKGRIPMLFKIGALHQLFRGASTKND